MDPKLSSTPMCLSAGQRLHLRYWEGVARLELDGTMVVLCCIMVYVCICMIMYVHLHLQEYNIINIYKFYTQTASATLFCVCPNHFAQDLEVEGARIIKNLLSSREISLVYILKSSRLPGSGSKYLNPTEF